MITFKNGSTWNLSAGSPSLDRFFVTVDPSTLPDGTCWTVVEALKTGAVNRTRFVLERDAREYANSVVRDGVMVHLEGHRADDHNPG